MRQGEMLIGSGEPGMDSLAVMSGDDLDRNRGRGIIPRFFKAHVKKSDGSGYLEVEYLELLIPGDSKSSPVHLVDDRLRAQYRPHYKAFLEGQVPPSDGTAIEMWLGKEDPRIHMLHSMHLKTVENVAEMNDTVIAQIGIGGRELKKRAAKFLEIQVDSQAADQIAAKDDMIKDLLKRLAKLENKGDAEDEDEDKDDPDNSVSLAPKTQIKPVAEKKVKNKGRGK